MYVCASVSLFMDVCVKCVHVCVCVHMCGHVCLGIWAACMFVHGCKLVFEWSVCV